MIKTLDKIFKNFRDCFAREASFNWFVIIITVIMLRSDKLGLTSIIRDLGLASKHYESIIHFFHSSSWSIEPILEKWVQVVKTFAPLYYENDSVVLIGDGMKQSKEARKMPCVKKLHQESENCSKSEYIFGHMFGGIGVLSGTSSKLFCLPLFITLQDGIKTFFQWQAPEGEQPQRQESHVVQMIENLHHVAGMFGNAILLLDRYFLSTNALIKLDTLNEKSQYSLHIVTRAKRSCVAYEDPISLKGKRGRPAKKGVSIKLHELFDTKKSAFVTTQILMYGKEETVSYYCINLLWGQKLYQKLRFVLVIYQGKQSILVSTDLEHSPETIIRLYSYRFKIECTFREMKQVIGGFSYQFWSKSMPRLNRFQKKDMPSPVDEITDIKDRENILKTIKAIEGYVMCSCIALGLLQILAMHFSGQINMISFRYLRTLSNETMSEASVASYLRKSIFRSLDKHKDLSIARIIKSKQEDFDFNEVQQAS